MATYTPAVGGPITFRLLLSAPGIDGSADVSDRHVPGGDYNYVDIGGRTLNSWEAEGLFSSYADFKAMLGYSGSQGTLVYTEDATAGEISLNVVLKKVLRKKAMGRGQSFASLSLLIL